MNTFTHTHFDRPTMDHPTGTPQPTAQDWATLLSLVMLNKGITEMRICRADLLAASAKPMRLIVTDEGQFGYLLQLTDVPDFNL